MQQEDQALAQQCGTLAQSSREAEQWLKENRALAGTSCDALQKEMRKAARFFSKCHNAALRKMCVGVFGPSQSGKSYLISALARNASGELLADFAGELHDFITEINPEGGKESTGLVTRFTTSLPAAMPAGYPICLRLLTECDVVRVLANTYYADCDHKEAPVQEAILATLSSLEQRATSPAPSPISSDDVEDLREYMDNNFGSRPRVQLLQRIYWARAAELAPRLALADRAELFGLLWNGTAAFTQLFFHLCSALQALGNPAEAFCPISGLIPRASSIIDVALLRGLEENMQNQQDLLSVCSSTGVKADLPRAFVTALTAEITICMKEKPDDFFDYTDLLDFPGYRSRLKLERLDEELKREGMLENLFLRGKVAYLFERYCAEKELNSMLLCIGPGNQEVQDLPRAVYNWICTTHGEVPARRAGKDPALFFVLSKMDMEFEKKKGTPSVNMRWDTRLQSSLLDFFGKHNDWPMNWDGTQPFRNVFLLRNPNFRCEAIFSFENDKESGIRPDQIDYVDEVRAAFVESPLVQQHVADPALIWQAAMTLNDGGVGLLRQRLRPLCNPALKREQLAITITECRERVAAALSPLWKTDDKEEERRQKLALAKHLAKTLAAIMEAQRFGEFLLHLQVKDYELYELYFEVEQKNLKDEQENAPRAVVGTRVFSEDLLGDLFDEPESPTPAAQETAFRDDAARFADIVIHYWTERLHNLAGNTALCQRFGIAPADMEKLVHELSAAISRLRLEEGLATALRHSASYVNMARNQLIWKQVSIAADTLNAFVDWLGFDPRRVALEQRQVALNGRVFTLFPDREAVCGEPHINPEPVAFEQAWYRDWLKALLHLIEANVDFEGGSALDRAQNDRLGALLKQFN